MIINVRPMEAQDISVVASIHAEAFPRQSRSGEWIECNHRAYPRIQYFVAVADNLVLGFIEWIQKSGFSEEVVIELEQTAVSSKYQGRGIGKQLIKESLPLISKQLASRGAVLKHAMVTTRSDNQAQLLYKSTLGASIEATIVNLYSADEVVMVARNILDHRFEKGAEDV